MTVTNEAMTVYDIDASLEFARAARVWACSPAPDMPSTSFSRELRFRQLFDVWIDEVTQLEEPTTISWDLRFLTAWLRPLGVAACPICVLPLSDCVLIERHRWCHDCGRFGPHATCGECGECASREADLSCDCVSGLTVEGSCLPFQNYDLEFQGEDPKSYKGLKRHLGAEIEVANIENPTTELARLLKSKAISTVEDGSLPDEGVELVTQPMSGSTWKETVSNLGGRLNNADAAVTTACGLHIHVDARDMNVWDVRRTVMAYAWVENALFAAVENDGRRRRQYCKPCGPLFAAKMREITTREAFLAWMYGDLPAADGRWDYNHKESKLARWAAHRRRQATINRKYNDMRYYALNLHTYFMRGTLEFRHHHGTVSGEDIMNWGLVVGSLVDWCATHSDQELRELFQKFKRQPRQGLLHMIRNEDSSARDWLKQAWRRFGPRAARGAIPAPLVTSPGAQDDLPCGCIECRRERGEI